MHATKEAMLAGDLLVQESIRLAASAPKMNLPDVANEVSIFPSDLGRPFSIQVRIDEHSPFQFRADGFLVTTPLGSTGHALSLGGPVLDIGLDAMLLIAAAPLRRGFLPLIINSSQPVYLEAEKPVQLYVDGESIVELTTKTRVTVEKSNRSLRILRHPARFHMRLQEKLLRC